MTPHFCMASQTCSFILAFNHEQEDYLDFTINIISPISMLLYNLHLGGTVDAEMITTIGFAT